MSSSIQPSDLYNNVLDITGKDRKELEGYRIGSNLKLIPKTKISEYFWNLGLGNYAWTRRLFFGVDYVEAANNLNKLHSNETYRLNCERVSSLLPILLKDTKLSREEENALVKLSSSFNTGVLTSPNLAILHSSTLDPNSNHFNSDRGGTRIREDGGVDVWVCDMKEKNLSPQEAFEKAEKMSQQISQRLKPAQASLKSITENYTELMKQLGDVEGNVLIQQTFKVGREEAREFIDTIPAGDNLSLVVTLKKGTVGSCLISGNEVSSLTTKNSLDKWELNYQVVAPKYTLLMSFTDGLSKGLIGNDKQEQFRRLGNVLKDARYDLPYDWIEGQISYNVKMPKLSTRLTPSEACTRAFNYIEANLRETRQNIKNSIGKVREEREIISENKYKAEENLNQINEELNAVLKEEEEVSKRHKNILRNLGIFEAELASHLHNTPLSTEDPNYKNWSEQQSKFLRHIERSIDTLKLEENKLRAELCKLAPKVKDLSEKKEMLETQILAYQNKIEEHNRHIKSLEDKGVIPPEKEDVRPALQTLKNNIENRYRRLSDADWPQDQSTQNVENPQTLSVDDVLIIAVKPLPI